MQTTTNDSKTYGANGYRDILKINKVTLFVYYNYVITFKLFNYKQKTKITTNNYKQF